MLKENLIEQLRESKFDNFKKFSELFDFINSEKLGQEYKDAYEEAVAEAKNLVDAKSKSSWDPAKFNDDIEGKYLNITKDYISALLRCVENYNPPVNLPEGPLWE